MNILVVDDSEDSRDLTEAALMSAGYRDVITAGSAYEAYQKLGLEKRGNGRDESFDLVLLDIVMPQIDGIEACARIRGDARYADVPIIMVTSLGDMDSLANAFVAGATDYITKPLNKVELLARVRSALKLKSELDRRQARERELLEFLSTWGDRRNATAVDDVTGLLTGEVAEAYLMASAKHHPDEIISVIAIAIDRLDVYRSFQGETAVRGILSQVADAVRANSATLGAVAAAYRNGVLILVLPDYGNEAACKLAETLRQSVARLQIPNAESLAADHVTASVVVVSGGLRRGIERAHLLRRAMSAIKGVAVGGGNQVIGVDL